MKKYLVCVAIISVIMTLSAMPAFSQDSQVSGEGDMSEAVKDSEVASTEAAGKTNELSIYGEVQAVNAGASSITVQYYDYDNDEEKTLEVALDNDSRLENVKAIGEVKAGDWVDVTYIVIDGKNRASIVSVEVEEPSMENDVPMDVTEE